MHLFTVSAFPSRTPEEPCPSSISKSILLSAHAMPAPGLAVLGHNPRCPGSCPATLSFQNWLRRKEEFVGSQELVCSWIQFR